MCQLPKASANAYTKTSKFFSLLDTGSHTHVPAQVVTMTLWYLTETTHSCHDQSYSCKTYNYTRNYYESQSIGS